MSTLSPYCRSRNHPKPSLCSSNPHSVKESPNSTNCGVCAYEGFAATSCPFERKRLLTILDRSFIAKESCGESRKQMGSRQPWTRQVPCIAARLSRGAQAPCEDNGEVPTFVDDARFTLVFALQEPTQAFCGLIKAPFYHRSTEEYEFR